MQSSPCVAQERCSDQRLPVLLLSVGRSKPPRAVRRGEGREAGALAI